jgi:hypothetical protein
MAVGRQRDRACTLGREAKKVGMSAAMLTMSLYIMRARIGWQSQAALSFRRLAEQKRGFLELASTRKS